MKLGTLYSHTGSTFPNAKVTGYDSVLTDGKERILFVTHYLIKGVLTFQYKINADGKHDCLTNSTLWLVVDGEI